MNRRSNIAAENDRTVLEMIFEESKRADRPSKVKYTDEERNEYFEVFATKHVLKDYKISESQIQKGHVGGSNDAGLDGIHVFADGDWVDDSNVSEVVSRTNKSQIDLVLIQTKNSTSMGANAIQNLHSFATELLDPQKDIQSAKRTIDPRVISICTTFRKIYASPSERKPKVNIKFYYVTKAETAHPDVCHTCDLWCEHVEMLIPESECKCRLVVAEELLRLSRIPIRNDCSLSVTQDHVLSEDTNSFIALVRLQDYFSFITDDDGYLNDMLFESNVRDWEGKNKVNKLIQKSLASPPVKDFWWLNDGVSILATYARNTGSEIQLRNPQIVNGMQTSRTIQQHFVDNPQGDLEQRRILVRIIVLSDEELDAREDIIRATNSHTPVKAEELRSLDKIHYNIETYLKAQEPPIYYDRRKKQYSNQTPRIPARNIINILKLSQSVLATLLREPENARKRPGDYLQSGNHDEYLSVFTDDIPLDFYYFCAMFFKKVDSFLSNDQGFSKTEIRQVKTLRYHVMTHVVVRYLDTPRCKIKLPKSYKGKLNIEQVSEQLISESAHMVLDQYRESRRMMGDGFLWATFEKDFFNALDGLLPDLQTWLTQRANAKRQEAE